MGQFLTAAPRVLYKFRSNIHRDVRCLLVARELYCASPLDLNDPFDCYPTIDIPLPEEREVLVEAVVASAPPGREADARHRCELLLTSERHRQRYLDELYRKDIGRLGILSLSAPRDNPLLWTHYAGNSTGFAVGYRGTDEGDLEAVGAFPVKYTTQRPALSPFKDEGVEDWLPVLWGKSKHWSYEEEWRYVRMWNEGGPGTMKVPIGSIVEVCLGCRMSARDRALVITAARDLPDKPVILQARTMSDRYGLAFDPVD